MKNKTPKIRYYSDEYNDDFFNTRTNKECYIDENYEYEIKKPIDKFSSWLLYYTMLPILWLEGIFLREIKVVGKKKIKKLKKTGYIMYANHTHFRDSEMGQVFLASPRRTFVITNKDSFSIKGVTKIVKYLGGLPVPDTIGGLKNLNKVVTKYMEKRKAIMIYPEAHIWPYYTGSRHLRTTSFKYCVANKVPCVPIAVTYQKPIFFLRLFHMPRMVIYVGDPKMPDSNLDFKQNAIMLRDYTYNFIKTTVEAHSTYKKVDYIYKPKEEIDKINELKK